MLRLVPLLALTACGVSDVFTCTTDEQCVRGGDIGRCEAIHACSFQDSTCSGGWRFADFAPGGLSSACTGPMVDAPPSSVPDVPIPDAPPAADARPGADARPASDAPAAIDIVAAATADTMLVSSSPTANYGTATELTGDDSDVILVRFDLATLGSGTVESVELHFWTTATGGLGRGQLNVFRLLEDWSESAATWSNRLTTTSWTGAGASGGSRDATVFGTATPSVNDTEQVVTLSSSLVQGWLAAPATNFGLVLAVENSVNRKLIIVSREGLAGRAPSLHVRIRR